MRRVDQRNVLSARVALVVSALALTQAPACTSIVVVDDYTFDTDPCGPQPTACTGGRELAFVIRSSDITRADPEGHRDGFDLDGTGEPICGQRDFASADGRSALDNQMAEIFELYEQLAMVNLRTQSEADIVSGRSLQIVVLSHVDDLAHDDCIEVTQRVGVLPEGMNAADLDRDGDGLLDAGLTLDYLPPSGHDESACSIDGVVHARFPPLVSLLPGLDIEATIDRGRLRMPVGPEGSTAAALGGSLRIAELTSLPAAVIEFFRPRADLDPSSRSARDCGSISYAIRLDMVPVVLGTRRSP